MQNTERLRLAIIIGSTRRGRFAPIVAKWFVSHPRRRDDVDVDVIDLAEARFPEVLGDKAGREVSAVTQQLAAADAFVVVPRNTTTAFRRL